LRTKKAIILSKLAKSSKATSKVFDEIDDDNDNDSEFTEKIFNNDSKGNVYLNTINSDIDKGTISEGCSSGYASSVVSDFPERFTITSTKSSTSNISQAKADYKEFTKMYLKVKFEQLYNKHEGQNIPQNVIWNEVIKQAIPKSEWPDFILKELKNLEKYIKFTKKTSNKRMMEPISEETYNNHIV